MFCDVNRVLNHNYIFLKRGKPTSQLDFLNCGFLNCSATVKDFREVCAGLLELICNYNRLYQSLKSNHQFCLHVQQKQGDQCRRPTGPVGFQTLSNHTFPAKRLFF